MAEWIWRPRQLLVMEAGCKLTIPRAIQYYRLISTELPNMILSLPVLLLASTYHILDHVNNFFFNEDVNNLDNIL